MDGGQKPDTRPGAGRAAAALRRLRRDCRAATAVEYGFILALIVLAMLGALQSVGNVTSSMWNNVNTKVTAAH